MKPLLSTLASITLGVLLLATIAAFHASTPPEETGTLYGTITDADTGARLIGANVMLKGTTLGATVGVEGRYEIENIPPGTYTVRAAFPGFGAKENEVLIRAGQRTRLDLVLRADMSGSEEVVAEPERSLIQQDVSPAHAISMSRQAYAPATSKHAAPQGHWLDRMPPGYNTEDYAHIDENAFRRADEHPLSTFAIDVDGASYTNVRRFIQGEARRPVKDAVRIEELVNYFDYAYPEPEGDEPFAVYTEIGAAPWNAAHRLVHVGLQGRAIEGDRPASNLVFLLDVSGSMDMPNKLPLLKRAFGLLADELTEADRVAIVVYAGREALVLPSTPGSEKDAIRDAIEGLRAGGSTAGAKGIELAYQIAQQHFIEGGTNRVILATDGDFNVGVSSDAELVRLIEEKRASGTFLTVLGFGSGNLKDNKMEQLANHGNGAYYYIDSDLEARKVLVEELGATLHTIAKDVKVQIEFNPAHVAAYRLIGYENRLLAAEDFADDTKDAGELGAGHTVTALYEIVPVGVATDAAIRSRGELRYQQVATTDAADDELMLVKLRFKQPDGDTSRELRRPLRAPDGDPAWEETTDDFRFAAAVAGFGMLLRESEHAGTTTLDDVERWAQGAIGSDDGHYRASFLDLLRTYRALIDGTEPTASR